MKKVKFFIRKLITQTPIQYFPVTVQKGLAKGARWTLFPNSSLWRSHADLEVEAAIRQYGSFPGATCWEVGAHFGIYTFSMAIGAGRHGHIYGFEPDPIAFKRCQLHMQMNALHWVKIFNVAASNGEEPLNLILENGGGTGESRIASENDISEQKHVTVTQVSAVRLDNLLDQGQIRAPQFIKIDVEGHGAKVLLGAQEAIKKYRPVILIVFHGPSELEETKQLLQPLGYRSFTCQGSEISWEASLWRNTILRCATQNV